MRACMKRMAILFMVLCVAMGAVPAEAAAAKISKSSLTLTAGKSATLKVKNEKKKVTWKSSNKTVASVSKKGKVTAKKAGTATITASAGGNTYTCKVTVKAKKVKVKKIKLNKSKYTVYTGSRITLKVSVSPSGASDKRVSWKSSNPKVVSVNADGVVTAKKAGTAVITASTKDGSKKKASCKITVKKGTKKTEEVQPFKPDSVSKPGDSSKPDTSSKPAAPSEPAAPSKPDTFPEPSAPETERKLTAIEASCSLKEISSAGEVQNQNLTVYGIYSDGSRGKLLSYKVNGSYDASKNCFRFTVTSGDCSTVFKVAKKADPNLTGIEASCKLDKVHAGYEFKTSDFEVKGVYDDGTRKAITFNVTISYADGYYLADITAGGFQKQVKIPVEKDNTPKITSICYNLNPSYVYTGENLAPGQLKVTVKYSNGESKEVTDYTCDFTPKDTAGSYSFTVFWNGNAKTIPITVKETEAPEPTLKSIDAKLNRSYIFSDETLSASDISLIGTYSDGTTRQLDGFAFQVVPAAGHGQKATVNIQYQGNSLSLQITSYVRTEPKSVEFQYTHNKVLVGESINKADVKVIVTDFDGNTHEVTDFEIFFTPVSEAGEYPFTVSYKGFSQEFKATVTEK